MSKPGRLEADVRVEADVRSPPILLTPMLPPMPASDVRVGVELDAGRRPGRWKQWRLFSWSRSIASASPRTRLPTQ